MAVADATDKPIHKNAELITRYHNAIQKLEGCRELAFVAGVHAGWTTDTMDGLLDFCYQRCLRYRDAEKETNPTNARNDFFSNMGHSFRKLSHIIALLEAKSPSSNVNAPPEEQTQPKRQYFVTLDQAAALVNRHKRTLENRKKAMTMPMPKVKGGGGKPDEWLWDELRPWLEKEFGKQLPEIPPHYAGK